MRLKKTLNPNFIEKGNLIMGVYKGAYSGDYEGDLGDDLSWMPSDKPNVYVRDKQTGKGTDLSRKIDRDQTNGGFSGPLPRGRK
jgi:hypothetical protein